jgi:hypothetical protein
MDDRLLPSIRRSFTFSTTDNVPYPYTARLANESGCIHTLAVGSRRFPNMFVVAGIVITGLVLAAVVAGLGPSGQIVCGSGHVLDRIAQAVTQPLGAGHVDGPGASYCVVPSTNAWVMAAIAFAALSGGCLVAMRRF